MTKILSILAVLFISVGVFTSCGILEDNDLDNYVITQESNVQEDKKAEAKNLDFVVANLPPEVQEVVMTVFPEKDGKLVAIKKDWLLPKANYVPITVDPASDPGFWGNIIDIGLLVGGVFFPPLLAFEGIGAVLFKRKRDHWKEAIKSALPYDGKVNLKQAAVSVGRSIGMAHSSKDTKAVFESEKEIPDDEVVIINE